MADVAEAAVGLVVSGEEYLVVPPDAHGDDIVRMGGLQVKVEDKDQPAVLKGQHAVFQPFSFVFLRVTVLLW